MIDRSASVVHSFNIGSREKDASPKSRKSISFPGKKAIHCVEEGKKGSAFGIYLSKKDTFKRAWQGTKVLLSRDSKKHWRTLIDTGASRSFVSLVERLVERAS